MEHSPITQLQIHFDYLVQALPQILSNIWSCKGKVDKEDIDTVMLLRKEESKNSSK